VRCVHEAQLHDRSSFVTLTYDQAHVPKDWSVDVKHWQNFAKRLRHAIGPFRFFHCGEYGDRNQRPHYHALIFGHNFDFDRVPIGRDLYMSPLLAKTWGYGMVSVGNLTFQSAAYVARYAMKKIGGPPADLQYVRTDGKTSWWVKPEYVTMSRNPGIGSKWYDKFHTDVFPADEVIIEGRNYPVPRFYTSKLPEATAEAIKDARRRNAAKHKEDSTWQRLRVRERVAVARLGQSLRQL